MNLKTDFPIELTCGKLSSLRRSLSDSTDPENLVTLPPLDSPISFISFTSNEQHLLVYTQNATLYLYSLSALQSGSESGRLIISSGTTNSNNEVVFSPDIPLKDMLPRPRNSNEVLLLNSNGIATIYNIRTNQLQHLCSSTSVISWSPLGKAITIGTASPNQSLAQYTLEGVLSKSYALPDDLNSKFEMISLRWVSAGKYFVVLNDGESEYQVSLVSTDKDTSTSTWLTTSQACQPFGDESRTPSWYTTIIRAWGGRNFPFVFVTASAQSNDLCILTEEGLIEMAEDSARAQLAFRDDGEASPLGFALDFSSTEPVIDPFKGTDECDPLPIVWVLDEQGCLCAWNIVYKLGIKEGTVLLKNIMEDYKRTNTEASEASQDFPQSSMTNTPVAEHKPVFGSSGFGSSAFPTFSSSGFGSASKNSPQENTSESSSVPVFGGISFGNTGFKPAQTSTSTTSSGSVFGESPFGNTSFKSTTDSQLNQSAAKPSLFGSSTAVSPFGALSSQQPSDNTSSIFGKSGFSSKSSFATESSQQTSSPFGAASSQPLSTFGQGLPGSSTNSNIFGSLSKKSLDSQATSTHLVPRSEQPSSSLHGGDSDDDPSKFEDSSDPEDDSDSDIGDESHGDLSGNSIETVGNLMSKLGTKTEFPPASGSVFSNPTNAQGFAPVSLNGLNENSSSSSPLPRSENLLNDKGIGNNPSIIPENLDVRDAFHGFRVTKPSKSSILSEPKSTNIHSDGSKELSDGDKTPTAFAFDNILETLSDTKSTKLEDSAPTKSSVVNLEKPLVDEDIPSSSDTENTHLEPITVIENAPLPPDPKSSFSNLESNKPSFQPSISKSAIDSVPLESKESNDGDSMERENLLTPSVSPEALEVDPENTDSFTRRIQEEAEEVIDNADTSLIAENHAKEKQNDTDESVKSENDSADDIEDDTANLSDLSDEYVKKYLRKKSMRISKFIGGCEGYEESENNFEDESENKYEDEDGYEDGYEDEFQETSVAPQITYSDIATQFPEPGDIPDEPTLSDYYYESDFEDSRKISFHSAISVPAYISLEAIELPAVGDTYESEAVSIFKEINAQFEILAMNSYSMATFIEANQPVLDSEGYLVERARHGLHDVNQVDKWKLSECEDLEPLLDHMTALLEKVQASQKTEFDKNVKKSLIQCTTHLDQIKELLQYHKRFLESSTSRLGGLPPKAAMLQTTLRKHMKETTNFLSKLERSVNVAKSQYSTSNTQGIGRNVSLSDVQESIQKITRLAARKSDDVDQLAFRIRELKTNGPGEHNKMILEENAAPDTPSKLQTSSKFLLDSSHNESIDFPGAENKSLISPSSFFSSFAAGSLSRQQALMDSEKIDITEHQNRHNLRGSIGQVLRNRPVSQIANHGRQIVRGRCQ